MLLDVLFNALAMGLNTISKHGSTADPIFCYFYIRSRNIHLFNIAPLYDTIFKNIFLKHFPKGL